MLTAVFERLSPWPQRIIDFHIKVEGLGESEFLNKIVPRIRIAMAVPTLIMLIQEIIGVTLLIKTGHFTLGEVCIRLTFVTYFSLALIYIYSFCYKHSRLASCMQNAAPKLNCYTGRDLPQFKFIILMFTSSVYSAVIGMTVVSPLLRFYLTPQKTTYLLFPNWYPVDVLSSGWFWPAVAYEFVVYWHFNTLALSFCPMFYYAVLAMKIRLDALGHFIEEIPSDVDRKGASDKNEGTAGTFPEDDTSTDMILGQPSTSKSSIVVQDPRIRENMKINRLNKGMEDWNVLRREMMLVNRTFAALLDTTHFVAFLTVIAMTAVVTKELQDSDESVSDTIHSKAHYLLAALAGAVHVYTVSYVITQVEESHKNLQLSLWKCHWESEELKFKKFLLYCKVVLSLPLKTKVYRCHPINLFTFTEDLFRAWSFLNFLRNAMATR